MSVDLKARLNINSAEEDPEDKRVALRVNKTSILYFALSHKVLTVFTDLSANPLKWMYLGLSVW